jgi:excisionase family DNA binding protein
MDEKLLTIDEAAYAARVSRKTVERWRKSGAIRAVKACDAARNWLIPASEVDPQAKIRPNGPKTGHKPI